MKTEPCDAISIIVDGSKSYGRRSLVVKGAEAKGMASYPYGNGGNSLHYSGGSRRPLKEGH